MLNFLRVSVKYFLKHLPTANPPIWAIMGHMNVTLVYGTYSNSTALAAQDLQVELEKLGHSILLLQAQELTPEVLAKSSFLILASPSWDYNGEQGMPHEDFTQFHQQHPDLQLSGLPFAVMGLGDSSFTYFCGAVDHLTKWFTQYGAKSMIDSLKIDQYYIDENAAKEAIAGWAQALHEHSLSTMKQ